MPIAGLNFDKLVVEKKKPVKPPLKINSNLTVKDLKKAEIDTPKGEMVLRFDFEFKLEYQPNIADMTIGGHVLYSDKEKVAGGMLKEWKKSKKFNPEIVRNVLNAALIRSNIKALLLSQDVGLPPHIQFPMITSKKKGSNYLG